MFCRSRSSGASQSQIWAAYQTAPRRGLWVYRLERPPCQHPKGLSVNYPRAYRRKEHHRVNRVVRPNNQVFCRTSSRPSGCLASRLTLQEQAKENIVRPFELLVSPLNTGRADWGEEDRLRDGGGIEVIEPINAFHRPRERMAGGFVSPWHLTPGSTDSVVFDQVCGPLLTH